MTKFNIDELHYDDNSRKSMIISMITHRTATIKVNYMFTN